MPELTEEEKNQLFFHLTPKDEQEVGSLNNKEFIEYSESFTNEINKTIRRYLSFPLLEQVEKVRNDISLRQKYLDQRNSGKKKKKNTKLKVLELLDKIIADLSEDLKDVKQPDKYKTRMEEKIRIQINSQIVSGQFDAFFRFMFVQALIGNQTHVSDLQYRQKLKAEFDLIQPLKFKDVLYEVINPIFLNPGPDEDLKHFWTENRSLELLAKYNRLSLIIEYARKVLKEDRKQKTVLQENFGISDDWIHLVDSTQKIKDLAMDWALNLMNIEGAMKQFSALRKSNKQKDALELSLEHLHNRILKKARRIYPFKDMLVYCTFYGGGRQLGGVSPKSEKVKLLKVTDWSEEEAYQSNIFTKQLGW